MIKKFEEYLKLVGNSSNTIRAYVSDVKNCIKQDIISPDFKSFDQNKFLTASQSSQTKKRWVASLTKYAKFCIHEGIITENPVIDVIIPKTKPKEPRIADFKETQNLIEKIEDLEIKTILSILSTTGCRISSLINIKVEDISDSFLLFTQAKGNKPYKAFLNDNTKKLIDLYILTNKKSPNDFLFSNTANMPYSTSALRIKLRRYLGSNYKNPHSHRHGFATYLLQKQVSLPIIQQTMNHTNINTTMHYIHILPENIKNEFLAKNIFS